MKAVRKRRAWSQEELGQRMASHGLPWDRFTVANLETGRRGSVTLDEVGALARVLGVAPIHLILPIDDAPTIKLDPDQSFPVSETRAWFIGEEPLGADPRVYRSEVPL